MILEVEKLNKYFGGLRAVNDISFHVAPGEIVGLIGPNGAGKTTLFNLLSGFIEPTSGRILFNQEDISRLKSPHKIIRKRMGRTFQIPKPIRSATVLQNVMIGAFARTNDKQEAQDQASKILEFLKLADLRDTLAESLPLPFLKRLEIARTLATQPIFMMLDEVMAGLNETEIQELISILRECNQRGVTLFIVEHIMAAIMQISQRIIVINFGEKIAEGTPEEIMNNEKVIESYLGEDFSLA